MKKLLLNYKLDRRFTKSLYLLAATLGASLLIFTLLKVTEFNVIFSAIAIEVVVISIYCLSRYENYRKILISFDNKYNGRSLAEALNSVDERTHPLYNLAMQQAEEFYNKQARVSLWRFYLGISLNMLLLVVLLNLNFLFNLQMSVEQEKPRAEVPKVFQLATLKISEPESEIEAKMLDVIEVFFEGNSTNGIADLELKIGLNGSPLAPIQLADSKKNGGSFTGNTLLELENYELNPFDLIVCHLEGNTLIDGTRKKVLSKPIFISIKPFEQEVYEVAGGETSAMVTLINQWISTQLDINKTEFIAKNLVAQNRTEFKEDIATLKIKLKDSQTVLIEEIREFLNSGDARSVNADAFNELQLAIEAMERAVTGDGDVCGEQQKALGHLLRSLKNVQKVSSKQQQQDSPPSEKNPFEEELPQQLEKPKEADSLEKKVESLIQREQEITKESNMQEAGKQQEELTKDIEELNESAKNLDTAQKNAQKATEALKGELDREAEIYLEKTLNSLKQTQEELRERSSNSTQKTLEKLDEELENIQKNVNDKELEDTLNALAEETQKMVKEAEQTNQKGSWKDANLLHDFAVDIHNIKFNIDEKIPEQAKVEIVKALDNIRLKIATSRTSMVSPLQEISRYVATIEELIAIKKYVTRNRDEGQLEQQYLLKEQKKIRKFLPLTLKLTQIVHKTECAEFDFATLDTIVIAEELDLEKLKSRLSDLLIILRKGGARYNFEQEEVPESYRVVVQEYFEMLSRE